MRSRLRQKCQNLHGNVQKGEDDCQLKDCTEAGKPEEDGGTTRGKTGASGSGHVRERNTECSW